MITMCLDSLIETNKDITEGYKVFDLTWGHITFILQDGYRLNGKLHDSERDKIPQRRWIEAVCQSVCDSFLYPYMSGFHFYETLEGVQEYAHQVGAPWRIMKIKVKEIMASGYQCPLESRTDFNKVHVAKEMFILHSVCSSD